MTYATANYNNANLTRETTRWISGDYTIAKIANLDYVPSGTHKRLGLPTHCDVYYTSTGDWCATLDDAIAACQEADADTVDDSDRSDILDAEICEELAINVSLVGYDGEGTAIYEIRRNDVRVDYIRESADGLYELPQLSFAYTTFHSLNATAIALMEFLRPADVLLAEAVARHTVADRLTLPNYI